MQPNKLITIYFACKLFFPLKFFIKEKKYFNNSPVGLCAIKRNLLLAFIVFKTLIQFICKDNVFNA